MPTIDERQGADYFHIMFLLSKSCLPQVLLPLIFRYSFPFFDFFDVLQKAVIQHPPRQGDAVQYGDDVVVLHSRALFNVYEGMTVQIVESWGDPRDLCAMDFINDHNILLFSAFALKFLERPEDRGDIKMSCMHPIINQINPADVWVFFTTFRSRAILVTMLLARSEDNLRRALQLIAACPCSEEERRQLFYIAYLSFKQFKSSAMPDQFLTFERL